MEDQLIRMLYPVMKQVARSQLRKDAAKQELQTTELIHEAFIKLKNQQAVPWQNRSHFLAISAKVVRRILVDHFRAMHNQKRGGMEADLTLDRHADFIVGESNVQIDWLELHDLVNELDGIDEDSARMLELRFFGGLTVEETAEVCKVSQATVARNWRFAKSWLLSRLTSN